jgi:hypothetical protein
MENGSLSAATCHARPLVWPIYRWASLSADTYPAEVQQSLTAAGILLFEQLFEASPQMKRLFPFVDAEGNPSRQVQSLNGSLLACSRSHMTCNVMRPTQIDKRFDVIC